MAKPLESTALLKEVLRGMPLADQKIIRLALGNQPLTVLQRLALAAARLRLQKAIGGRMAAAKMTPAARRLRARKAAQARWRKVADET